MFKVMGLIQFLEARYILNLTPRAELVVVGIVVQEIDDLIIIIFCYSNIFLRDFCWFNKSFFAIRHSVYY